MAQVDTFGQPGSLLLPPNPRDPDPNGPVSETATSSFVLTELLTTDGTDSQEIPPRITEKDAVEQDMDVDRADVLTDGKPRMAFHAAFVHLLHLLINFSLAPKDDALREDMFPMYV